MREARAICAELMTPVIPEAADPDRPYLCLVFDDILCNTPDEQMHRDLTLEEASQAHRIISIHNTSQNKDLESDEAADSGSLFRLQKALNKVDMVTLSGFPDCITR